MELSTDEPGTSLKTQRASHNPDKRRVESSAKTLTQALSLKDLAGVVEDSLGELAQAKIRFGMNFFFVILGLVAWYNDPEIGLAWVITTFLVCLGSASVLYVWAKFLGQLDAKPGTRVAQRVACIIVDNLAITWLLYFGGNALAGAYGLYLWITIGYGMRFGLPYLYGNQVASLLAFGTITLLSPFWRENLSVSIGLFLVLLIVPLYASFLIRRLHTAVSESRSAYAAKSDFVARMSHELRTPLHGIISVADLLSRTEASNRQKELFRIISVSSNTLLELINRILEISKFEDGTSSLQRIPTNLHGVIHHALSILRPQAQLKGLELEFFLDLHVDPWVMAPPLQLQEVLINICGNAVKFTEEGEVRLLMSSIPALGEKTGLRLEISDTGPGISQEHLKKIFNPFYQADGSTTRRHNGTGLGTAIAKELVRLMEGQIQVDSEPGRGTRFKIDLVFDRPKEPDPTSHDGIQIGLLGKSTLLDRAAELIVERNARVMRLEELKPDERLWLSTPPAAILVDLENFEISASSIRENFDGPGEEIFIPIFATGARRFRERAIILGYNCFIESENLEDDLLRALSLAAEFRRDYVEEIPSNETGERIRVLIAEDNLTNQTIARMALVEGGFQCTIVSDGEQALAELSASRHDIALIDMHMPLIDGLEVARLYNFAVTDPAKRIPIVMVTADSRPEIAADADLAGITRFLTKPLKPSMMIELINRLMRERGKEPVQRSPLRIAKQYLDFTENFARVIDEELLTELLQYMEGEERGEFFSEFFEDARTYIETLESGSDEEGIKKIRGGMHALSGSARMVGALKLASYARRIEFMSTSDIRQTMPHLQRELWHVLEESESALKKIAKLA